RVRLRSEPEPGRQIAPGSKAFGIADACDQCTGCYGTDAWHARKPFARRVRLVPHHDFAFEQSHLAAKLRQLIEQRLQSQTCFAAKPPVVVIGDDRCKRFERLLAFSCDNPEFPTPRAYNIGDLCSLPPQNIARPMQ